MSITLRELAAELQVQYSSVRRHVKTRNVFHFKSPQEQGWAWAVSDRAAALIRAHYADASTADELRDWLTVGQVAALMGLDRSILYRRRRQGRLNVRTRRAIGPGGSGNLLFHPDDVRRVMSARPVAPPSIPRGAYSVSMLADLLGLCRSTPRQWQRNGCPVAGRTQRGHVYFRLPEVLAWLEARPGRPFASDHERLTLACCIATLRAHLAQQQAA
ncbi:hypothetical protein [Deinococcus humi]|uniref:Helix-turn-helix domain-containing protein n=1 Tax=Deinococcus humi TaxID=662880 RepID=A0A7W8JQN2_9DEIO|nr:hypothetical protein [Deinococcus humi]MBB5361354.1 hypothetical protein [Deinococcus humi]GGO19616.1 hypothetical protein GCM10008949_04160 [Deinococcus humi]